MCIYIYIYMRLKFNFYLSLFYLLALFILILYIYLFLREKDGKKHLEDILRLLLNIFIYEKKCMCIV